MKNRVLPTIVAILGLALAAVLIGCQSRNQGGSAEPSAAPASEAEVGSTQPITLTWDQQLNCVNFSQGRITIKVGDRIRFNSGVQQTVTLRISSNAFGTTDTTMVIGANGSYTTQRAATAGSYDVNSTPAMCALPNGGIGPTIVVEESK
jgi:plastocyanin